MRYFVAAPLIAIAVSAMASVPPPPPSYVDQAARVILSPTTDETSIQGLFSADVVVQENGKTVARGARAWNEWRRGNASPNRPQVLGYTESSTSEPGSLLVIETVDTVRRDDLPRTAIADPRMQTRATLYQFGDDRKIHSILISAVKGLFMKP